MRSDSHAYYFCLTRLSSKKSKLQSLNLAPVMLERLMPITTEEEPEDVDDDAPSRVSARLHRSIPTPSYIPV